VIAEDAADAQVPSECRLSAAKLAARLGDAICKSSCASCGSAHATSALASAARRECLDRILVVNRRHLDRVLRAYIRHYHEHRPHRSLEQRPPIEQPPPASETDGELDHVRCRDLLGGLIHEYKAAA
jgi:hypothetical protein